MGVTRMHRGFFVFFLRVLLLGSCLMLFPAPRHTAAASEIPSVGDLVAWGRYEQDNDLENGPESVLWRVLARRGTTVLLFSDAGLDARKFHHDNMPVQWSDSDLRAWLNHDFLQQLLSEEEQTAVCVSHLKALPHPRFPTDPGRDTDDLIFLLSMQEVERYLPEPDDRLCVCTPYAKASGAYRGENGMSGWWLRTTGHSADDEARVSTEGHFVNYDVDWGKDVVRPALWVDAALAELIVTKN